MRFEEMAEAAGLPRKPFYTAKEIAKATWMPESTVRKAIELGELPGHLPAWKVRGTVVHRDDVNAWLDGM